MQTMQIFAKMTIYTVLLPSLCIILVKQERVAALRRKREEQAQWEKENIAEDQ